MIPEKERRLVMAMELTLEEIESGIALVRGFVEDIEHTRIGLVITSHPDYSQIYGILDNLRELVKEYRTDLGNEYGHTHDTSDWFDMTIRPFGK
jgi:hypothetical protein